MPSTIPRLFCLSFAALVSAMNLSAQEPAELKLVWSDEFSTPGAPDPTKWSYETGLVRNGELQYYTRDRPENVRVADGNLIIEARKEPFLGPDGKKAAYTSGSLETKGHADWLYGRIEVRAKIPQGRGMWPAIWMMPTDGTGGWPACGEIDIMENVGVDPDTIHATIHTQAYNHTKHTQKSGRLQVPKPYEDFHVYTLDWSPEKMDFFVDGTLYFTYKNEGTGSATWPYDKPFYLKLNSAVGGSWGGMKGVDETIFPQKFYLDYVRVYQKTTTP